MTPVCWSVHGSPVNIIATLNRYIPADYCNGNACACILVKLIVFVKFGISLVGVEFFQLITVFIDVKKILALSIST